MSDNPSTVGRMANLLHFALEKKFDGKQWPLPKLIVMVPDDDIIKTIGDQAQDVSKSFSRLLNYIMTEQEHAVAIFKENLPAKCLKERYPCFLWIHAPNHDGFCNNSLRFKFNRSIEETAKLHPNVYSLMLKKVWDPKDENLFLKECQRFTADGYKSYWEAVDKTVRYFDSVMLKKHDKERRKTLNSRQDSQAGHGSDDRFRWQNPKFNRDFHRMPSFRKLPPPPPSLPPRRLSFDD